MKKIARVIITTECNLQCSYCCNKLPEIQNSFKMTTFDEFLKMDYDVVNITGGEPMLAQLKLKSLLTYLNRKPTIRIYLYTNGLLLPKSPEIYSMIDGVNIGCHSTFTKAFVGALEWRKKIKNVRFHVREGKSTNDQKNALYMYNIQLVEWKMNDCNKTEEDRFII